MSCSSGAPGPSACTWPAGCCPAGASQMSTPTNTTPVVTLVVVVVPDSGERYLSTWLFEEAK